MALVLPATLSPSKVSTFSDCALAFRYSAVDQLPEPPNLAASRGTLVHLALEHLFELDAPDRTPEAGHDALSRAIAELADHPDITDLNLSSEDTATLHRDAERLVGAYFELEDPTTIHPIGLELRLEAQVGGLRLRGIIDRLEIGPQGGLVVTDYKSGRAPRESHTQGRLGGVTFYALLCQELFGVLPEKVQLLYLGDKVVIATQPTEQSIRGLSTKIRALWSAVETACEREDFRPRPGPLCAYCGFAAFCPAQGGDPALAAAIVAERASADDHRQTPAA